MGLLIDGRWHDQWYQTSKDGAFQRERTSLRERGVSILESQLSSKRSEWLLQADPSGIRR
jgi:glutathionyl-hydroquinone reductase